MIYLLRCEQDTDTLMAGWIKIGTTTRLSVRLKQIADEIGHMPTVLAVLDGAFAEEHALHARFHYARARGEWFLASQDLLRLIETEGRPWDGTDEVPLSALGVAVKIDRWIGSKAKMVAAARKVTLAEYLSEIMRPLVDRDFAMEMHRIEKGEAKP